MQRNPEFTGYNSRDSDVFNLVFRCVTLEKNSKIVGYLSQHADYKYFMAQASLI